MMAVVTTTTDMTVSQMTASLLGLGGGPLLEKSGRESCACGEAMRARSFLMPPSARTGRGMCCFTLPGILCVRRPASLISMAKFSYAYSKARIRSIVAQADLLPRILWNSL